jgi:hypothetical protein
MSHINPTVTPQVSVMMSAQDLLDASENTGLTLVGDNGGLSKVTGEISRSSAMRGFLAVETEHGTLYLDEDFDVTVLVS